MSNDAFSFFPGFTDGGFATVGGFFSGCKGAAGACVEPAEVSHDDVDVWFWATKPSSRVLDGIVAEACDCSDEVGVCDAIAGD